MSSDKKIKQIVNMAQAEGEDVVFYLHYSECMTEIMLGVITKQAVTPEQYIQALADFVNEVSEHPQNLFVEPVDHSEDPGLH